jgi:AcrR family transcriptional regulator
MPKVVDHEARRKEVIDVVWRLIATDGIDAVTTRRIAAESGYANGALLYYFKNKDEVIAAAFESAFEATNARANVKDPRRHGLEGLRTLCMEILPLDERRCLEAKVVITYWQQALGSASKADLFRERVAHWRTELCRRLEEARADGDVARNVDVVAAVDELILLLMGAQSLAVLTPQDVTPSRQLAQLDAFVSRLRT